MKSGRQGREEILARRRLHARISKRMSVEPWREPDRMPSGAIRAEQAKLLHDRTLGQRPRFYADKRFTCVECGTEEVWTAAAQQWWYEEAKGKIATRANRCRACRRTGRLRRSQERRVHVEGMVDKHGLEGAARRLCLTVSALERMRARWND